MLEYVYVYIAKICGASKIWSNMTFLYMDENGMFEVLNFTNERSFTHILGIGILWQSLISVHTIKILFNGPLQNHMFLKD